MLCGSLCNGKDGAGLEERLEDGGRLFEVVMHDVHKHIGIHEIQNKLAGRRIGLIVLGPLTAELVGFVLIEG